MSKILIDRATVEQALEAMETGGWNMTTRAITALRAALAEPAQEPMPTRDDDEAQVLARLSKTPAEAYERGYMDGHSRGVEAERERCARICDNLDVMSRDPMVCRGSAQECAEAIRAELAEPQNTDFERWWDNALDGPTPMAPISKETAQWIWNAAKAEPVQEPWEHLKQYGYAPGSYMSRCHVCDKIASGVDKRAITCRPCAEARHAALAEPVQEPASDFERGFQRGWQRAMRERDRDALVRAKVEDELAKSIARLAEPVQEPLTDTYVQNVPDKCDRIVWRGQYFHLPVNSTSEPVREPVATMTVREDMGADFKFNRPHTLLPGQRFYLCLADGQAETCRCPDCVDNGPEGKCVRWLVGECEGPKIGGQA